MMTPRQVRTASRVIAAADAAIVALGVLALLFPGQLIPGYEHYTGYSWPALMHTSPATGHFILAGFPGWCAERCRWPAPQRDRADRFPGTATVGMVDTVDRQRHRAGGTDHL